MIYIHLAEGFEEIEAVTVLDVLKRGNIPVQSISVSENKYVVGAHGIVLETDNDIQEADYTSCDMIILPGGMPGTLNLQKHTGLIEKIIEFDQNKKWLAAICAAPMILGNLELLKNRRATCFPGFEEELYGAKLTNESVVQDGHIITSRGPGTAMLFALKIVEILKDDNTALDLKEKMIISR